MHKQNNQSQDTFWMAKTRKKIFKIVYNHSIFSISNKMSSLYLQAVKIYRLDDFSKDLFFFLTYNQGAYFMKHYFISVKHRE